MNRIAIEPGFRANYKTGSSKIGCWGIKIVFIKSNRFIKIKNLNIVKTCFGTIDKIWICSYILYFKILDLGTRDDWWLGISPEGIGTVGMLINFAVTLAVSSVTPPPPPEVQAMVDEIRLPSREA